LTPDLLTNSPAINPSQVAQLSLSPTSQSPTLGLSPTAAIRPRDCPRPGFPEGAAARRSPHLPPAAAAHGRREMSYMRGDLLTKTRKLVKGLAKPAPTWLKAMEESVLS